MVRPVINPYPCHIVNPPISPVLYRENTDSYPVLHRASVKVVGNKSIKLWERVLYIKCLLIERESLLFYVESILGLIDHVWRS